MILIESFDGVFNISSKIQTSTAKFDYNMRACGLSEALTIIKRIEKRYKQFKQPCLVDVGGETLIYVETELKRIAQLDEKQRNKELSSSLRAFAARFFDMAVEIPKVKQLGKPKVRNMSEKKTFTKKKGYLYREDVQKWTDANGDPCIWYECRDSACKIVLPSMRAFVNHAKREHDDMNLDPIVFKTSKKIKMMVMV